VKFGGNGASVWSVNPASGDVPLLPLDPNDPDDAYCPAAGCPDFGIMFYNTEAMNVPLGDPTTTTDDVLVHDWCQALWTFQNGGGNPADFPNPAPLIIPDDSPSTPVNEYTAWFDVRCAGTIHLNGSGAPISLYPLKLPVGEAPCRGVTVGPDYCFNNLVIYQYRALNIPGDDVILNGSDSDLVVRGTIYVPYGDVRANGNDGSVTVDQVIAWRFTFNGNAGNINVLNDQDFVFQFEVVGLVE